MKLNYFIFSLLTFTFPAFSQNNLDFENDSSKSELSESEENKITFKDSTKDYSAFRKKLYDLYRNKNMIKVIPLPPATVSNSKVELLPLYRPGKRNIRLLTNQNKK